MKLSQASKVYELVDEINKLDSDRIKLLKKDFGYYMNYFSFLGEKLTLCSSVVDIIKKNVIIAIEEKIKFLEQEINNIQCQD